MTKFNWSFESVFYIVDSAIVRAQAWKESNRFGTFVAIGIAEIRNKINPSDCWWVASSQNPADLITRPCSPNEIEKDSLRQIGPFFFTSSVEDWPKEKKKIIWQTKLAMLCLVLEEYESYSKF